MACGRQPACHQTTVEARLRLISRCRPPSPGQAGQKSPRHRIQSARPSNDLTGIVDSSMPSRHCRVADQKAQRRPRVLAGNRLASRTMTHEPFDSLRRIDSALPARTIPLPPARGITRTVRWVWAYNSSGWSGRPQAGSYISFCRSPPAGDPASHSLFVSANSARGPIPACHFQSRGRPAMAQ